MVWQWVDDPSDWPGEDRRRVLVRMSQIWETTVALMLAERIISKPEQQLQAALSSESTHDTTQGVIYGHNSHLYAIYAVILDRACSTNPSTELLDLFREVLGALIVFAEPVNLHTLASLICPSDSDLQSFTRRIRTTVLAYLQAVLIVPGVDHTLPSRDDEPIESIHKSFKDYLTDKSRSDPQFPARSSRAAQTDGHAVIRSRGGP